MPETLKHINDVFIGAAVDLGLEDSRKLRVGTTGVRLTFIARLTMAC
jgi:hypothetical protein